MNKLVIEIKGDEAEKIMTDFHNKDWKSVSKAVCKLMKQATFEDVTKTQLQKDIEEDKHTLHYPEDWTTEGVYEVISTQSEVAKKMVEVMMHMALESNLPDDKRKSIWEIIRLFYAANADFEEMLEYINEKGYVSEKDEEGYEWDDEDDWDNEDNWDDWEGEEDESDENHNE